MRIFIYIYVFVLGFTASAYGQNASSACGNGRFVDDVFTDVTKTTDVEFGYNQSIDYSTGNSTPVTLKLDFYEPTGDVATQRPLLILAFGGAFIDGHRQDLDDLCQAYARKGYATATIDYRLLYPSLANYFKVYSRPDLIADEVVRATSDVKAAVRFFKHDAATTNAFHIDPTKIFVGGFSAGAIAAVQAAYVDDVNENPGTTAAYAANGGLEGNTDLLAPDNLLPTYDATGIAGVLNLAGGVNDLTILSAGNPPLYSAQGTKDEVVPYDCGTVSPTPYVVCGSHQMQATATAVGIRNQLYSVEGGNHSSPRAEPDRSQIIAESAAFFQSLICPPNPLPVVLKSFEGRTSGTDCAATLTWQTVSELNSWAYEVQTSANGRAFTTLGTVPSQNRLTGATYTFRAGVLLEARYFRLKLLDTDGTSAYSPVVVLDASCTASKLVLVPNPAHDQATVRGLPPGRSEALLYNATGQCVARASGEGSISVPLSELPAGVYLLKAVSAAGTQAGSAKLVKE